MTDRNNLREVLPDSRAADSTPLQDLPTDSERAAVRARLRNRQRRVLLMVGVPLLVIAAAVYAFLQAGRYVSTDNAYVKGHIVNISAEVSGIIKSVGAQEYEHVAAGAELLSLNDETYLIAVEHAEATLAEIRSEIDADKLAYQRAGWHVLTVPAGTSSPIPQTPAFVVREIPAFWVYYARAVFG